MSQTISVGVVGPSHWAYMASVMAEKLQKISEAKRTTARQIPAGVYRDALEFYDSSEKFVGRFGLGELTK